MKIQLKAIQVQERLSEETYCYSASVYVDGKRVGVVSNCGCGGPNEHDFNYALVAQINEYLIANNPPLEFEMGGEVHKMDYDFESFCGDAVTRHLASKDYRRACGRMFLVACQPVGEQRGIYNVTKSDRLVRMSDEEALAAIRSIVGDGEAVVLNFVEDGLEQYLKGTR